MRRWFYIPLLIALLALAGTSAVSAQNKAFVWQRVDSDVRVQPDGTLRVVETITLRFDGGSFTFAYRDLPERRLDGISNIAVADDERAYTQVDDEDSEQPYSFAVFREDGAQRVRWVYPPSEGERTFRLSYDVAGAVRRLDEVDQVWWSMVFPDREETVEQATGRITLPEPVPAAEIKADTPDVRGEVQIGDGAVTVSGANIVPGDELTLRMTFPKGVVGGSAPGWQLADEAQQRYNADTRPTVNVVLSAVSAALALALGTWLIVWYRRSRDPRPSEVMPSSYSTLQPPSDLPPALAAKLAGRPGHDAFMATLIGLANRGYLTVTEHEASWGHKPRIELTRSDAPLDRLQSFERQVLETVFGDETTVELKQRAAEIGKQLGAFDALVGQELAPHGYLRPEGRRARNMMIGVGVVLLVAGGVAVIPAFIFAERISWWLPVLAVVLVLAGLGFMIAGSMIHGLTPRGADERERWQGFAGSLRSTQSGTTPALSFTDLLPFAYAFGAANRLSRAYNDDTGVPVWYYSTIMHGSGGGNGGAGLSNSMLMQDFSQNFLSSLQSAGSSASGAGAGGGGGASGGGGGGAG